jgi:hypothetical protein
MHVFVGLLVCDAVCRLFTAKSRSFTVVNVSVRGPIGRAGRRRHARHVRPVCPLPAVMFVGRLASLCSKVRLRLSRARWRCRAMCYHLHAFCAAVRSRSYIRRIASSQHPQMPRTSLKSSRPVNVCHTGFAVPSNAMANRMTNATIALHPGWRERAERFGLLRTNEAPNPRQ